MDLCEVVSSGSYGDSLMAYIDELHDALIEIISNPDLTRDQWRESIDAKVRELIEKYREEH